MRVEVQRACLHHELGLRGLKVESEWPLPVKYEGHFLDVGYRIDLLVEETVVVETKAISKLLPIHEAQLLSYLKLGAKPVGLLINFHVASLVDGIRRMVL